MTRAGPTGPNGPNGPDRPDTTGAAGSLVVSGGGTTMVSTDVLLAQAARVRLLQADAAGWSERAARIRALESDSAPMWAAGDPGLAVFAARHAIDSVEEHSGALADALLAAAEAYGHAERTAEMLARIAGVWVGHTLGRLAPMILLSAAVPALTAGVVAWMLGGLPGRTGTGAAPNAAGRWLIENPRLLTNPVLVAAVRVIVSSVDDAAAGTLGVPLPVSVVLGDEGLQMLGVTTSAAGVLAAARSAGMLREAPVSVARVGRVRAARPPAGFGDLAARIPAVSSGGPQVRIERYGGSANRAWLVYIGGTAEWSPVAAGEPWDLTSNVVAVADQGAGSYRAVVQAMRGAGIRPTDAVIPVGHSQGGLVAAQVAASGEFNTVAVATFGAPIAQVPVPDGLSTVAVEHSDDLVPALGGATRDPGARLTVRREAYAGVEVPDSPLPAHSLATYRETARLVDASAEPRLADFRALVTDLVGTAPGTASRWRGTRVVATASE